MKKVIVTAFPNIVPAGTAVTRVGAGSNLKVAIGRAVDAIIESDKLKGKKILLPMKLVVNPYEGTIEKSNG
jgi:hypothetical protein